jgi:acetyl-CoA carboxylase biotin carboxylase subunit
VRDDGGVYEGAEVSIYYDPMISKLAAWGRTREETIARLRRALAEYTVGGIKTTLPFFREITRDAEFIAGQLDTGFIERFNARRAAALEAAQDEAASGEEIVRRDMAIIAAVLADDRGAKFALPSQQQPAAARGMESSRWKLAGRTALHQSRS